MVTSHTRRLACAAAAALTVSLIAINGSATSPATAAGPTYTATITRTEHGIPHISAEDWGSLGYGSGYAAAQTSTCALADVVLTGRGERSKYLGPDEKFDDGVAINGTNFQIDALVADLHNRKVVEGILADPKAGPSDTAKKMVAGYAAGVNKYLVDSGGAA